jgi:hypothetical protein
MIAVVLFQIYLISILLSLAISIYRWNVSDSSVHTISVLLFITLLSEIITLICRWQGVNFYLVYHIFNPIELWLISIYFLRTLNIKHPNLPYIILVICIIIATINSFFLQSTRTINSYFLLFESFCVIGMSLYGMYYILKTEQIVSIVTYPHFWIFSCLLLYASSTFLFWGYFQRFFEEHWEYANALMYIQAGVNIITYLLLGLTIFFTCKPKAL